MRFIQQMLGHARLDTTQIYTEVTISARRDAYARSHPSAAPDQAGEGRLPLSQDIEQNPDEPPPEV